MYSAGMERPPGTHESTPNSEDRDPQTDESGLSLAQLSSSFAKLFGRTDNSTVKLAVGPDGGPQVAAEHAASSESSLLADVAAAEACSVSPKSILEAILFIGHPENEPLPAQHIASLMRGVKSAEIEQLVAELNSDYDEQGAAYWIESLTAGYRMVLRSQLHSLRERFYGRIREIRLSQAAIDVLAVVAYSQPITRHEIDELRGRPCGTVLTQLVRRQLLRIHRDEQRPRHVVYHTTDRFLQLFGLDSLEELPRAQLASGLDS